MRHKRGKTKGKLESIFSKCLEVPALFTDEDAVNAVNANNSNKSIKN